MPIDRATLLFYDASSIIAAAGSPIGGSSFLLELCERRLLRAAVSHPVLVEAERNIRQKMRNRPEALPRFFDLLIRTPFEIAPVPLNRDRERYIQAVGEKDEHVLAAALAVGAAFLIVLDKAFEAGVNGGDFGIRALSPGEFIKTFLPKHPDFARLR